MRGRLLTDQDESGSSHAVVINQSMAERLWPHQDPLGRHLIDVGDEPTPAVWNQSRGCPWWWALSATLMVAVLRADSVTKSIYP